MGAIYDQIVAFFESDEWPVERHDEDDFLRTGFEGRNGRWECVAAAREEAERFVFYSVYPHTCPVERLPGIAEFLHRANDGLTLGCFELDYGDGSVRFRASIDVEKAELTIELCRNVVYAGCLTMDDYFPGITAIVQQGLTADGALELTEGQGDDDSDPS